MGVGLADAVADPAFAGRFLPFLQMVNVLPRMSPATQEAAAAVTRPSTVSFLGAIKTVSGMPRRVWNHLSRGARGEQPQPVARDQQLPPLAGELNRAVLEWTGGHAPALQFGEFKGDGGRHTVSTVFTPVIDPVYCTYRD